MGIFVTTGRIHTQAAHYERIVKQLSSRETYDANPFGDSGARLDQLHKLLRLASNQYEKSRNRSQSDIWRLCRTAETAYNLKKYLRFTTVEQSGMVITLPIPDQFYYILIYFCNSHIIYGKQTHKTVS